MRNLKTQKLVINAILIVLGAILHQITPALGAMQPDMAIAMLFVIVMLNKDYKTSVASALVIGIFAALTTKFPGGQLPNIIDKLITVQFVYLLVKLTDNKMNGTIKSLIRQILIFGVGTLISGTVFITSAFLIVGLPEGFSLQALFIGVVIPATIINIPAGIILNKIVERAGKATGISLAQ